MSKYKCNTYLLFSADLVVGAYESQLVVLLRYEREREWREKEREREGKGREKERGLGGGGRERERLCMYYNTCIIIIIIVSSFLSAGLYQLSPLPLICL